MQVRSPAFRRVHPLNELIVIELKESLGGQTNWDRSGCRRQQSVPIHLPHKNECILTGPDQVYAGSAFIQGLAYTIIRIRV
jgi:hypothetical protein